MYVHKLKVTFIFMDVTIFCELFSRTLTKDTKPLCKNVNCPLMIRWRENPVFFHRVWTDSSGSGLWMPQEKQHVAPARIGPPSHLVRRMDTTGDDDDAKDMVR